MSVSGSFEPLRSESIEEYGAEATLYRHTRTGAEVMSVRVDDENKVFGITFRTPPPDHTGIAHILEHCVLCGSRSYPTKEPFVELLKGSLQTFLNAFTYPDKTCYPVASQNLQDFYNLIDVYLDAVFYPLLTVEAFEQEGWHYELEAPDQPLSFKGVVFNEMKGVYSSPDSVLIEQAQHSLFPDTVYGLDSGGDPSRIPDLTHDQLVAFHRRFYHPSNSRIWFYGDDDPQRRLEYLEPWLSAFEARHPDSDVPLQKPFDAPRRMEHRYRTDDPHAKSFVALNWALPSPTDAQSALHATILAHILIGTPASPLRKALIDSGLGEDLCGCGLETHARQMFFSTGLKGVEPRRCGEVEALARRTLERLASEGIEAATVESSLNTVEFTLRENNTGSYPRGLSLMLRSLTSWLYGGDPFAPLLFAKPLADVRARWASGEPFFEKLVRAWLLDNPHHTVLTLHADPELGRQLDEAEKRRLDEARAGLTEDQLRELAAHTAALKARQTAPDDPAALAKIPRLSVKDLPRRNKNIPTAKLIVAKARALHHDIFTNGIFYLDVALNVRALSPGQLPYVPLLGRCLLETGTTREDFVALQQRIGSRTGGIVPRTFSSIVRETDSGTVWLVLRGKALDAQAADLIDILRDVLFHARLDLKTRIRQLAAEEKARLESDLIPSGHRFAALRARSLYNESDYAAERMGGVSYLVFLRNLIAEIDANWPAVADALENIRSLLLNRRTMIFNVTCSADTWTKVEPLLEEWIDSIPERPDRRPPWPLNAAPAFEGLAVPATVHYVAKVYDLRVGAHAFRGSDLVAARFLRNGYLWERVRMRGGAYGAFCSLDHRSGLVTFSSYRDPNLRETIEVFDQAAEFLKQIELDKNEMEKAIIGAIGDLDQHMLPDARGYAALCRWLANDPEPFRQRMREEILDAHVDDFRLLGEALRQAREYGRVAAVGSESSLSSVVGSSITRVL